jgi:hypothetical protein
MKINYFLLLLFILSIGFNAIAQDTSKKTKYAGYLKGGYFIELGDKGLARVKFDVVNGIKLNPNFFIGASLGVRYYLESEESIVPIQLDMMYRFSNDKKVSPFVSFNAGNGFHISRASEGTKRGGPIAGGTAGASILLKNNKQLLVGIDFEYQDNMYSARYGYGHHSWQSTYTFGASVAWGF